MKERLAFHKWKHAFDGEFKRTDKEKGTTPLQRRWVKRAWSSVYGIEGAVCGFPVEKNEGLYLHGKVDKIEVHHIVNRGYASFVLGWDIDKINSPFNLYPLCITHHRAKGLRELDYKNELVSAVHPDMEVARRGYTGREHPTSFDFAFEDRRETMRRYEEYHNPDWDRAMIGKAEEVYYRYLQLQMDLRGEYFDKFPPRTK